MELGGGRQGAGNRVQQRLQLVWRLAAYLGGGFLLPAGDGGTPWYRPGRCGGWWRRLARVGARDGGTAEDDSGGVAEWGGRTAARCEVELGILFFYERRAREADQAE
jgi:hypothetical protein